MMKNKISLKTSINLNELGPEETREAGRLFSVVIRVETDRERKDVRQGPRWHPRLGDLPEGLVATATVYSRERTQHRQQREEGTRGESRGAWCVFRVLPQVSPHTCCSQQRAVRVLGVPSARSPGALAAGPVGSSSGTHRTHQFQGWWGPSRNPPDAGPGSALQPSLPKNEQSGLLA